MTSVKVSMYVLALLALFRTLSGTTASDSSELRESVPSVADVVRRFNVGNKAGRILVREQARLSERLAGDCPDNVTYRPIDGVCNNLKHPGWGAPLHEQLRLLTPEYDDGRGSPRLFGKSDKPLPSAREISSACFGVNRPGTENRPFSQMIMQFGQFVDHDITSTPAKRAPGCCTGLDSEGTHPDYRNGGPCFPIKLLDDDAPWTDTKCMPFSRSLPAHTDEESIRREQVNMLTSYLDGSNVYSISKEGLKTLRTHSGGLMLTSADNFLPTSDSSTCFKRGNSSCFNAGDFRVNTFPGLVVLQTVWLREHNRLASELAKINTHWDDEKLFQEARKIVIASMQHITYDHWLKEVLGPQIYDFFQLLDDSVYDEDVNPGIYNSFSTAAFRFGHSQLASTYAVKGDPHIAITKMFLDPTYTMGDGFEVMLKGLMTGVGEKTDTNFAAGLRKVERIDINVALTLDLVALSIQRGRDHGLPGYMEFVNLWSSVVKDNSLVVSKPSIPLCAVGLYKSLDHVDLYLGSLDETPLKDALVGPTFAYIIAKQFHNLKKGDRFWYETKDTKIGFTQDQLLEIGKTSLARVFCDNTKLKKIQKNVFQLRTKSNDNVSCSGNKLPSIDLSKWSDSPAAG